MYTIQLTEEDMKRYRSAYHWRTVFQASADQQMASRLEPVEIIGADGIQLYQNTRYKGNVSDLEWHE